MRRYSRIAGTGSSLPPRRVTNDDLVAQLAQQGIETSDEWIVERTGIRARHFAAPDMGASDLAVPAAQAAMQAAGVQPADIDLIIVATSTPDMVFPSTAAIVQHKLGISGCPVFDVQAVCSGFVYALAVADALIANGTAHRALVIGAEVFSRLLDFKDRTTCVLFGDGAGAVVLEASDTPGILATDLHADGQLEDGLAIHLEQRVAQNLAAVDVARHAEDADMAAIGMQVARKDAGRFRGLQHHCAGAVAE